MACWKSWTKYVLFDEDKLLQKKKWDEKYEDVKPVMWDNINIPFTFQPSIAQNKKSPTPPITKWTVQKEEYSFSSVVTTSNSTYMEKFGILKCQRLFAENNKW